MKKIALTGNMGCGKSYVANIIRSYGICVLDCDKIAFEKREAHRKELSIMFQVDASDTKEIAKLIFQDDQKKEQLENFLYPLIQEEIMHFFKAHQEQRLVVIEVPLLYEKGWEEMFDEVWVVACEEELAIKRLMKNRKFGEADIRLRLRKQMSIKEKIKRADVVLYNEDASISEQIHKRLEKEGIVSC